MTFALTLILSSLEEEKLTGPRLFIDVAVANPSVGFTVPQGGRFFEDSVVFQKSAFKPQLAKTKGRRSAASLDFDLIF